MGAVHMKLQMLCMHNNSYMYSQGAGRVSTPVSLTLVTCASPSQADILSFKRRQNLMIFEVSKPSTIDRHPQQQQNYLFHLHHKEDVHFSFYDAHLHVQAAAVDMLMQCFISLPCHYMPCPPCEIKQQPSGLHRTRRHSYNMACITHVYATLIVQSVDTGANISYIVP
jgi:hypothetical protein